jgi:hypothetical protein
MRRFIRAIPWQGWVMLVWFGIIAALMLRPRPSATIEGRAMSFCWEVGDAAFLGMQDDVDSRWIHVDDDEDGCGAQEINSGRAP